jgi:hypothetical protein
MKLFSILATFTLPLVVNAAANILDNDEVQIDSSRKSESPFRPGAAICTFAPDIDCFPNTSGFPPCCSTLGGNCENGARTLADITCAASLCTNHGYGCYKRKGMPKCCTQNGGSGCTLYDNVGCDMPLPPAPSPNRSPVGGDVCTLPPNPNCYTRFGGYPRCCKTTKTCSAQGYTPSSEYIDVA